MERNENSNRRLFFRYVIPSVLSFALSGIYAIVDGFFVGNSIGDAGLSAINIAYPITAAIQATGTGIGMGGAVRYSVLSAAGDERKAMKYSAMSVWLMILLSIAISLSVLLSSSGLISMLGAEGLLLELGNEYIRIIAAGAALQIFSTGLVPFMRNYGGAFWAMAAMICGFIANITLDYAFVWVMGLGMTGAALATVIGQGLTMVAAITYCALKRKLTVRIEAEDVRETAVHILRIGLAPFGLALAPNISLVIVNRFSSYYGGEKAIAAYACISYIIWILYLILQGVGDGSQPLMSIFYGENDSRSLNEVKRLAYETAIALSLIGAAIILAGRERIGILFGSSDDVNSEISAAMPIFLATMPFAAITRIAAAAFYATEKSTVSYVLAFIEPVLMLALMLILPPLCGGQRMVWWCTALSGILTSIISMLLSSEYGRRLKGRRA